MEIGSNATTDGPDSGAAAVPSIPPFATRATVWAIMVLIAIAFSPVLENDFVNWDDSDNLLSNPYFRGLGWPQIRWAWTTFWVGVYQPIAWMLLELQYVLFGLRPWGYHLSSIILHSAVCLAVYSLTDHLIARCSVVDSSRRVAVALAVGVFALHPLRVEVVAWTSCQPYLPCALFAILSVLAYLRAYPAFGLESRFWRSVSLASFVASLLSHATAVCLPLVLLALDYFPLRRLVDLGSIRRAVLEKWLFILAAAIFTVLGYFAKQGNASHPIEPPPILLRLGLAAYATFFYPLKTLLPIGLQVHYPIPGKAPRDNGVVFLASLSVVLVSAAVIAFRRRSPGLLTAWVSYVAILLPNLGLIPFGSQLVADRYSYLSSVVVTVALAYGFTRVPVARSRIAFAAGMVVLLGLTTLTWFQCRTWRNSETLWSRSLGLTGGNDPIAHALLGKALAQQGRVAEAMPQFEEALRLDPQSGWMHYNLGTAVLRMDRASEAVSYLETAVRLNPDLAEARENLAAALSLQGRAKEATAQLELVVKLRPDWLKTRKKLILGLIAQRRFAGAKAHLEVVLREDPSDVSSRLVLSRVLTDIGRPDDAVVQLNEVIRLNPDSADAHFNLALVLSAMGRLDAASAQLQEVLRLRPEDTGARQALERIRANR